MTSNLPQIGHTVIVADKANSYNGREAIVTGLQAYANGIPVRHGGSLTVYTVAVGNVSFALTRAKIRELKYGA